MAQKELSQRLSHWGEPPIYLSGGPHKNSPLGPPPNVCPRVEERITLWGEKPLTKKGRLVRALRFFKEGEL